MLISRSNYERIYRVINSILLSEGADPSVACIFFAGFGAYLLEQNLKIHAEPRGGLAAYCLGNDQRIVFGQSVGRGFTGEEYSFHCWVEADGWAIDFMAPAFARLDPALEVPPKMFQRRLQDMAPTLDDIKVPGDFFLRSSDASTRKHMSVLTSRQAYGDLADIALRWFKKDPRKMLATIQIGDQNGQLKNVPLLGEPLRGSW